MRLISAICSVRIKDMCACIETKMLDIQLVAEVGVAD